MPSDFKSVYIHRIYLDNVDETLAVYSRIPRPDDFVIHTPRLFHQWVIYARDRERRLNDNSGNIVPLGGEGIWYADAFEFLDNFDRLGL